MDARGGRSARHFGTRRGARVDTHHPRTAVPAEPPGCHPGGGGRARRWRRAGDGRPPGRPNPRRARPGRAGAAGHGPGPVEGLAPDAGGRAGPAGLVRDHGLRHDDRRTPGRDSRLRHRRDRRRASGWRGLAGHLGRPGRACANPGRGGVRRAQVDPGRRAHAGSAGVAWCPGRRVGDRRTAGVLQRNEWNARPGPGRLCPGSGRVAAAAVVARARRRTHLRATPRRRGTAPGRRRGRDRGRDP